MKVHLRVRRLAGRTMRILSLRPGTAVRFSTNLHHETWHILSNETGSHLLSHLMWGLSYQRHARTVFLIGPEHLCGTPFDGDRPDLIALVPAQCGMLDRDLAAALRQHARRPGPSDVTVRWRSHGLTQPEDAPRRIPWRQETVRRQAGVISYTAPPVVMRAQARRVARMRCAGWPSDYEYLDADGRSGRTNGEIQIFARFDEMVSAAAVARRELADQGVDPACPDNRMQLWTHSRAVYRRQQDARKRRASQPRTAMTSTAAISR